MTELQPTTNETAAEQYILFDLGVSAAPTAQPTFLQPLAVPEPKAAELVGRGRTRTKAIRPAAPPSGPTRLKIDPEPDIREPSPVLLAAVRAALFQTLAQEAQAIYQALSTNEALTNDSLVLAVEPARLGAAAQLLLDSPALNVAVSLLALGAVMRDG